MANRLRLYIFIGYPGAGKTTAAQIIEDAARAVHLWADRERQAMFDEPTHSEAESLHLYDKLNEQAEQLLEAGKSVIFDTSFNFYKDREYLRHIAEQASAEQIIVWVTTPKDVARARATGESGHIRNGYKAPMSHEQFDQIAGKLEPPRKNENFIKIDGTKIDKSRLLQLLNL